MVNAKSIAAYIKIVRPVNVAITGCAVALGIWLTGALPAIPFLALMAAAMAAAAYGNVINDILDIGSDRVSHPNRPLADGTMTPRAAAVFAGILAASSIAFAATVSALYLTAALVPLILLTLYSIYFKRTRLIGNILVSALTAYAIIFGAIPNPGVKILTLPAILAFLLNFCREIIKDIQDAAGDNAAGWTTSASLSPKTIRALLTGAAAAHILLIFAPSVIFGHFGMTYTAVCLTAVIPIHIYWTMLTLRSGIDKNAGRIALALKLEMAAGLAALALDKSIYYFIR